MSTLYAKISSDIRAGLGCRGSKHMDVCLHFSRSGGRTSDGGVRVLASVTKDGYQYKVMKVTADGEELYGKLTFNREGR